MSEIEPIRVVIVDDHSIVRRGLSAVLTTTDQIELVGEAEDGRAAIELCQRVQPDVVLMDLIMPGVDGIETTRIIHQRWPQIQVLVLTSFTEQEMIQGALEAGARGYLLKNVKGHELIEAIIQVHQGGQTISQEARKTLHLSEQLSMLDGEMLQDDISVANITDSLKKHLPFLFPDYFVQVHIFPDQDLYVTPDQEMDPKPDFGWEWLQTADEEEIIFKGRELPWGGGQSWGQVMLLTPIQGKNTGKVIGGIGLLSGDVVPNIDDLANISGSLAELLSTAIDRLRISNQKISSLQSTEEMQKVGKLQAHILPENPPYLDGWEIASRLVPAKETSGDFYDFIPLVNDNWGILIADVTDKGFGAAAFIAMCSSLIRTYAIRFPTLPALALSSVNERIFTDMRSGLFLTTFYGILEPQTGRLQYVNAGHKPPILFGDMESKPVDKLEQTGMALGISEEATWQQKMITLSPGDVLVMYTDGITEAHNKAGDHFSEPRLQAAAIGRKKENSAVETLELILEEIKDFTAGATGQDDMALVVLSKDR